MKKTLRIVASSAAIALALATPALAEKCKFGDHERDDADPPLKCKKCEAISDEIAKNDPKVWTLALKYGHPKRVELKRETGNPETLWYVYYELTNNDKLPRPCFIDVTAEGDKGKNKYEYHDTIVPEAKDELRRILGIKEGEVLHTQEELGLPQGATNQIPNKDGTVKDGDAKVVVHTIAPGETKKCVALFRKFDNEFDVLTIYFWGLANTTSAQPATPEKPDAVNPEAAPVAEGEYRLVNDDLNQHDPYRRKVVERVFAVEYACPGDEFSKTTRSITKHEEQLLRPRNLAKEETDPPRYPDVGVFGREIVEPEEKTVEGKKTAPFTFLGRKWIQVQKTIKSDLR